MKTIEKPFAKSSYAKMEEACTAMELGYRKLEDLKMIREKIAKGQMTPALYSFINADHSLENLFCNLPTPEAGMACESLRLSQLAIIDATIAEENIKLGSLVAVAWNAIKQALLMWLDRNRWERNHLNKLLGYYRQYAANYFGSSSEFSAMTVYMYRRTEWDEMLKAAARLREICRTIPQESDKVEDWIEASKPLMNDPLSKFGRYINEKGQLCRGNPNYIRQNDVCENLGWKFGGIAFYLEGAIKLLDDEIAARREFNKLDRLFTYDGKLTREQITFLRMVILTSKETSFMVARMLKLMLHRVIRQHCNTYKIGGRQDITNGAPRY